MTILAKTQEYLAEFEFGLFTISRYTDGHCVAIEGKGIAGEFRAETKAHGAEKAIETFLARVPAAPWQPLYKPHRMPR